MQWLIDMIVGIANAYTDTTCAAVAAGPGFVDRGDPAGFDWEKAALIKDNTWRDLNLSGIVPAASSAVVLRVALVNTNVAASILFREKGNANEINAAECHVQVANIGIAYDKTVAVDADRFIEYKINVATWTWLSILVAGWFGPES